MAGITSTRLTRYSPGWGSILSTGYVGTIEIEEVITTVVVSLNAGYSARSLNDEYETESQNAEYSAARV